MNRYRIVDCELRHLRELARTMRAEDREEIEAAGLVPRHALHLLWRESIVRRAAIIDGEVGVVWGDAGPMLGDHAGMWLFTTPAVARVPLAFFREGRREITELLRVRRVLRANVLASYSAALRFYAMLGFEIGEPFETGPYRRLFREIRLERS